MSRLSCLIAATVAFAATPVSAQTAANFPAKPLRLVVGFPPGGGADFVAREVAQRLGYTSQAAFSRAFKRITGSSPGASRRQRAL